MFTFIESSVFERLILIYLDDDEYAELQQYMMRNPVSSSAVRVVFASFGGFGGVWASEAG